MHLPLATGSRQIGPRTVWSDPDKSEQLGPGAKLSNYLGTHYLGPNCPGPNCPGAKCTGPICLEPSTYILFFGMRLFCVVVQNGSNDVRWSSQLLWCYYWQEIGNVSSDWGSPPSKWGGRLLFPAPQSSAVQAGLILTMHCKGFKGVRFPRSP